MGNTERQLPDAPALRHVIGDTPQKGKHLIYDSGSDVTAECDGGLAFAVGVATLECETVRDVQRFWQVQHPNGTALYHIMYNIDQSAVVIMKVY